MVYDEINENVASVAADAISSDKHKQCASCKRMETDCLKLKLLLYNFQIKRKLISMMSGARDKLIL